MKLNEIANSDDPALLAEQIKSKCRPYLEQINYDCDRYVLFRGLTQTQKPNGVAGILKVRKDRRPLGTPLSIHAAANDFFQKKFGIPVRSNAAFVTGDNTQAEEYGRPFVVFPIGAFRFFWSPQVYDFTVTMDAIFEDTSYYRRMTEEQQKMYRESPHGIVDSQALYKKWSGIWGEENPDEIKDMLHHLGYKDTDLQQAILSNKEIALVCDEYYAIDSHNYFTYVEPFLKK